MYAALIDNTNTIKSLRLIAKPEKFSLKQGWVLIDTDREDFAVGGQYANGTYISPPTDPKDHPLTPPQFHAMVDYIVAQTGVDIDKQIRAQIVEMKGGDATSLGARVALKTYEEAQQYRYDHPLSVGAAAGLIAAGVMTEQQRKDWWLEASQA